MVTLIEKKSSANEGLTEKDKDEILRPFINPFNGNKEYCLITEINNNTKLKSIEKTK